MTDTLSAHIKGTFRGSRALFIAIAAVVTLYLITPILIVFPAAFTEGNYIQVPPEGFTFKWFGRFFEDSGWMRAFGTSIQLSFIAALVATVTATLAVLGLSRSPRAGAWLRPVFFLPMVFPIVVMALGLLRGGIALGFGGSLVPLTVGQALICLPPAFIAVSTGMVRIDPALSRASNSMGASWWRTAFTVELPLMKGSVITAFLLSFVYGFDEVVLALFLAPASQTTLPAKLYAAASLSLDPTLASASVIIVGTLLAGVALYFLSGKLIQRSKRV